MRFLQDAIAKGATSIGGYFIAFATDGYGKLGLLITSITGFALCAGDSSHYSRNMHKSSSQVRSLNISANGDNPA